MSFLRRRRPLPPPAASSKESPSPPPVTAPALPCSLLGPRSRFTGDLDGPGQIRVQGRLEGAIRVRGDLEVGPRGSVGPEVAAQEVRLRGRAEGRIEARSILDAAAGSELRGEILTGRLRVATGAVLHGRVRLRREPSEP